MTAMSSSAEQVVLDQLKLSAFDLPTRDKVPVIQRAFSHIGVGWCLDIGIGTGYTTWRVFGQRATGCIDVFLFRLAWGSFRIEETFIVHPDGPELVTTFNSKYLDRYEPQSGHIRPGLPRPAPRRRLRATAAGWGATLFGAGP